jgi:DNA-binding Lrp family transcriptional regulator
MKETYNNEGKKASSKTCFLLLEPKTLCDSGEVAKRIAKCRGVKEVHITSGSYGFMVSAKANPEKVASEIRKLGKSKSVKVAVSHLIYK